MRPEESEPPARPIDSRKQNRTCHEHGRSATRRRIVIDGRHALAVGALRAQIANLEQGDRARRVEGLRVGVPIIGSHLQDSGLSRGALHEVIGGGADLTHGAAAALFAAAILARAKGLILWVLKACDLFAPGLATVGLYPDRLIYAEIGKEGTSFPSPRTGPAIASSPASSRRARG